MTFEDFAAAFGLPKKYLTAPIAHLGDTISFPSNESFIDIVNERDMFLGWLKEFEEKASEETYLEATLWLKQKMQEYYVEEAKKGLNGHYERNSKIFPQVR